MQSLSKKAIKEVGKSYQEKGYKITLRKFHIGPLRLYRILDSQGIKRKRPNAKKHKISDRTLKIRARIKMLKEEHPDWSLGAIGRELGLSSKTIKYHLEIMQNGK